MRCACRIALILLLAIALTLFAAPPMRNFAYAQSVSDWELSDGSAVGIMGIVLTPDEPGMTGAAWLHETVSFDESFRFDFKVYFGSSDEGGDGIVFVFTSYADAVSSASSKGYKGIMRSFAVEIDTFPNDGKHSGGDQGDQAEDHIGFLYGGMANHRFLGIPTTGVGNVEDGREHELALEWNASDRRFSVYLDDMTSPRAEIVDDIATKFIGQAAGVRFGAIASTGETPNLHYFLPIPRVEHIAPAVEPEPPVVPEVQPEPEPEPEPPVVPEVQPEPEPEPEPPVEPEVQPEPEPEPEPPVEPEVQPEPEPEPEPPVEPEVQPEPEPEPEPPVEPEVQPEPEPEPEPPVEPEVQPEPEPEPEPPVVPEVQPEPEPEPEPPAEPEVQPEPEPEPEPPVEPEVQPEPEPEPPVEPEVQPEPEPEPEPPVVPEVQPEPEPEPELPAEPAVFPITFVQTSIEDWTLAGDAFAEEGKYILTPDHSDRTGAAWCSKKIDLTRDFDLDFAVCLGAKNDNGADGVAFFIASEIATAKPSGGLGFGEIPESFGVEIDTYRNAVLGDPADDHIAVIYGGIVNHAVLDAAIRPIGNVEDGMEHHLRVIWNAETKTLSVYFDQMKYPRLVVKDNIAASYLGGATQAVFGFAGSTSTLSNVQYFVPGELVFAVAE
jgi:hypothetical protein